MMEYDERIVYIGSDLTKRELHKFRESYPDRYFMEGVYEQHLVGMAAGLALSGKIPYFNTIATFITRRCYEQILVDLCMHDLPVRLIGNGGGVVYAPLGGTHLAIEDMAILRVAPKMTIVAPCDAEEMKRVMAASVDWPHPLYIRLAKGGDEVVSRPELPFEIGKAVPLRDGGDVLFITTGITTQRALQAAELLAQDGVETSVLHSHTVKPLDAEEILKRVESVRVILTVEEHRVTGGLGGAVAELLAESGLLSDKRFRRIGFPDIFTEELGSQDLIMEKYGMSPETLAVAAAELLNQPS
jgi:transketolase